MSRSKLAKHAQSKVIKGSGRGYVPSTAGSPTWAAAPATIPAPPAPSGASSGHVDPFFRPEDLITQDNFWSQWNGTFADLDRQLGDLQRNTTFQRAQLADTHKGNVSGINDDAAARGISQSSIRDGSQAQEQTNFTRQDQSLTDALNSFATYVQQQKDNFNTQTAPGFNSAEDAQAVQNAQDVPQTPAPAAVTPTPARPTIISQHQQPIYRAVARNGWLVHVYPDGHSVKVRRI